MTNIDSVESRVESYLDRVRTALHGQPERQIDDIMRELRAHAIELAEGRGVEAALASLGDPVDLAKAYRAESQMVRAECAAHRYVSCWVCATPAGLGQDGSRRRCYMYSATSTW